MNSKTYCLWEHCAEIVIYGDYVYTFPSHLNGGGAPVTPVDKPPLALNKQTLWFFFWFMINILASTNDFNKYIWQKCLIASRKVNGCLGPFEGPSAAFSFLFFPLDIYLTIFWIQDVLLTWRTWKPQVFPLIYRKLGWHIAAKKRTKKKKINCQAGWCCRRLEILTLVGDVSTYLPVMKIGSKVTSQRNTRFIYFMLNFPNFHTLTVIQELHRHFKLLVERRNSRPDVVMQHNKWSKNHKLPSLELPRFFFSLHISRTELHTNSLMLFYKTRSFCFVCSPRAAVSPFHYDDPDHHCSIMKNEMLQLWSGLAGIRI